MNKLNDEDFKKSRIYLILKFKELLHNINSNKLLTQDELKAFNSISSTEFFLNHSDFLEQEIHELSTKDKFTNLSKLKIHFFDSFFDFLAIDTSFLINDLDLAIFPTLGKKITKIKKIKKTDNSKFDYFDFNGKCFSINLSNEDFRWNSLKISESITFITDNSCFLFDNKDFSEVSNNQKINVNLFKKIKKSLKIIENNSQEFYSDLMKRLDFIFPFGNDENFIFPNFTIPTLKRTIFLSVKLLEETDLHVSECLIHEASHCKLNIIQDTRLLFTSEHNKLEYYSPWRKDLRPLIGLIHGSFISNDLVDFYHELIQNENEYRDEAIDKINILIHQVLIAYDEINKEFLTEYGTVLLSSIRENVIDKASSIGINLNVLPQQVKSHKDKWKGTPQKI